MQSKEMNQFGTNMLSLQFNNNLMPLGDSIFTGIKIIDYRNGRFQGLFNSSTQARHGMGILIDDDMNIYCSEWQDGRMSGHTFIYMSNGNYFYGLWKGNEPHGNNLYRNKEFILIGTYHKGSNVGNTLAITDAINHVLVFSGEEIGSKDKRKDLQLISSQSILEISLFEDIIYHTAIKNNVKLNKNEVTLVNFLKYFAEKHNQYIQFTQKNGYYYFGFKVGIGFKFTLHGKVNHRINMISIGSHEDERVTDFGVKFHDSRCTQEGNFVLKETITYNKNSERPREKCLSIFQKNHKKALNFTNEYFQHKSHLISNIEHFLAERLYPRHQDDLKQQFENRRLEKQKAEDFQRQVNRPDKQDFKKLASNRYEKNTSVAYLQNRMPSKSITKNRSYSNLNKKISKSNLSPIKNEKSKPVYDYKNQQSVQYHEYKDIQDELNNYFKKQTICERCKSKEKRKSQSKVQNTSKKSLQRGSSNSKSAHKLHKDKSAKQIKYLVNYRPPIQRISQQNNERNRTKSSNNISKGVANQQEDKEKVRIQNELKIRRQIHQKQMERDAKNLQSIHYPLTFVDFLGIKASDRESQVYRHSLSPSSRQFRLSNANLLQPRYDYLFDKQMSNQHRNPDLYIGRHPSEDLATVNSIKKIDEVSNRRDKILRQFKALNTAVVPQAKHQKLQSYNQFTNPIAIKQAIQPNYRQRLDDKNKVSEFNKKYRNYLYPESSIIDKNNLENDLAFKYHHDQMSNHEPYVASFTFSPARRDAYSGISRAKGSNDLTSQQKNIRKKRYQYFFENSYQK